MCLQSLQTKCMDPFELKEALRLTFDMKLAPRQLGALAHLFGAGSGCGDDEDYEGGRIPAYSRCP